jgi:hypothetical protein
MHISVVLLGRFRSDLLAHKTEFNAMPIALDISISTFMKEKPNVTFTGNN